MKSYKVVLRHGHFINLETNERLILVQGFDFVISGNEKAFTNIDSKLLVKKGLSSEEKEKWALKKYGIGNNKLFLKAGTKLFFKFGNTKIVEGDHDMQYIFVCELLEDLYLYLLNDKDRNIPENWRLASCLCVLSECIYGGAVVSENIQASSLNSLFGNTVQFYFSLQRSSSTNVFQNFYIYEEWMTVKPNKVSADYYENLFMIRNRLVK